VRARPPRLGPDDAHLDGAADAGQRGDHALGVDPPKLGGVQGDDAVLHGEGARDHLELALEDGGGVAGDVGVVGGGGGRVRAERGDGDERKHEAEQGHVDLLARV
jgi:hypothetical protein